MVDKAHRMAWLVGHLDELPGSGIIYTLTVTATEEVTAFLRHPGHTVASCTGKTENADRQHAEVLLLPGKEDEAIWQCFASPAFPPEELVRRTLDVLARADRPMSLPALEPLVELRHSRPETRFKVLDVDGAVRRVKGG
ncbi:hypothetical protein AQJ91_29775 [Streptomyces dysideae]|uniref:Uncharacterized protein n=1 Tax=Streptomyces dysideae TaxID=909626 RepID=A0A124IE94_9ACTN|nr:hypothetical protein AQJ91_29775 [Streptomyces dysideae]